MMRTNGSACQKRSALWDAVLMRGFYYFRCFICERMMHIVAQKDDNRLKWKHFPNSRISLKIHMVGKESEK
jgi:hypothetical protein